MYIGNYALCGVCVDQFGSSLWYSYVGLVCILPFMENMQSMFKFAQRGLYFHIWFHSCNQGMPRSPIQFVLWCRSIIIGRWILVLPQTIIRWPPTNPYKMGDWLKHKLHQAFCICYKWWKDMGSLGCTMSLYKCYVVSDTSCICHSGTTCESWMQT
jgi:hypothetical protein